MWVQIVNSKDVWGVGLMEERLLEMSKELAKAYMSGVEKPIPNQVSNFYSF